MKAKLWLISDLHLRHKRIPVYSQRRWCMNDEELALLEQSIGKPRKEQWVPPSSTVEKMDQIIIDTINKYVGPHDILWHLGDFCFADKKHWHMTLLHYRKRIKCENMYFINGNHDNEDAMAEVFDQYDRFGKRIIRRVFDTRLIRWSGHKIFLSHYAHAIWNKNHRGAFMLYGHSHSSAEEALEKLMPGRRSMDVGIDNAYKIFGEPRPFSFEDDILPILGERPGFFLDHHDSEEVD